MPRNIRNETSDYLDFAQLGNINITDNIISSTDTNGNILLIPDGTGKLGIGTLTPAGTFHVSSGSSNVPCEFILEADSANTGSETTAIPRMIFRLDGGFDYSMIGQGDNNLIIANNTTSGGGINFKTNNVSGGYANAIDRMAISPSGIVSITNDTEATSVSSGSFYNSGGIGCAKTVFTRYLCIGAAQSANPSACVAITNTNQGFLPPRMTTTQKNAVSSPATGLMVYDTTLNKLCVYTGASWETITSS